ncbi:hypothetical protein M0812_02905 [Anaeramoeba flamelloides]|uniref:Endoglycoceramidase n=1 Tax=Anaeramoeba flamelloides TaxID=1746091 RepID=A0AAV7YN56_9EUKA|nr:hypothetical protein M0812_02905 [Anaeramoeba flamelloides]|eukprot:Anaeramoba_flamelloidesa808546_341.p1 GENE.a808546_341~~a808546_341.p1  ORF type:complete len:505 (-),score=106.23 a808546_341:376-1890(-)
MKQILYFFILILLPTLLTCLVQIDSKSNHFVDSSGRIVIFRGVNAVYKAFPFHPSRDKFDPKTSLVKEDFELLRSLGFNGVRLGVMWPGVEPKEGQYNGTYLQVMKDLVEEMNEYGIYSLIDFHQDVLSRKFCGEGVPNFYVKDDPILPFAEPVTEEPIPKNSDGYPKMEDCLKKLFAEYYLSAAASKAFQNLYDNVGGFQDKFREYWMQLATTFSDSNILGYEIINEPWAGDYFADPKIIIPSEADKINLMPMYKNVYADIRSVDQDHIIFYEQSLTDVIGENGFEGPPGDYSKDRNQVFSYHVYCSTDKNGSPKNLLFCNVTDELDWDDVWLSIDKMGVTGALTEYGAMPDNTISIENIHYIGKKVDSKFQSSLYWQYKYFMDYTTQSDEGESLFFNDGSLQEEKVKALSRTYAQKVQGMPKGMFFNPLNSAFSFSWKLDTSVTKPTVIFLNEKYYYPNGFNVRYNIQGCSYNQSETNYIEIVVPSSAPNDTLVTITITKKN